MENDTITLIISIILAIAGIIQIFALYTQNSNARLQLITDYTERWRECHNHWGEVIFIGRDSEEYYNIINEQTLKLLIEQIQEHRMDAPTIWARESTQITCGLMSEVCLRILQGQLSVSDAYPIFGSELLRQSRPLRSLLESEYNTFQYQDILSKHQKVRNEVQDWLVYHDGIRRRCLIIIDLFWAEAVRLQDLPPSDVRSAANAKCTSGKQSRNRIFKEVYRLNGILKILLAIRLYCFLQYSEYVSIHNWIGINKKKLDKRESLWSERLLLNYR